MKKKIIVDYNILNKLTSNYQGHKWKALFVWRHPKITMRKSQLQEKVYKEVTQKKKMKAGLLKLKNLFIKMTYTM